MYMIINGVIMYKRKMCMDKSESSEHVLLMVFFGQHSFTLV